MPDNVYWYSLKDPKPTEALAANMKTSVAVIGGGMAGLACAQKLNDAGIPVALIEKNFCGAGASGRTSGFITPDSEIELSALVNSYGPKKAKQIWEFVLSGVSMIRNNIRSYNIACDCQVQDSLFIANSAAGFRHIKREHETRLAMGYPSRLYNASAIRKILGSNGYAGAVRYPDTFGINSYLYCQAMRDRLRKSGVKIFEQTPALRIQDEAVITPGGRLSADHIIVCADRFIPDLGALKKEIYHVQTFLGITKPLPRQQIKEMFPAGAMMAWDSDLVYNYFRIAGDQRLLIGGGDLLYTYARNLSHNTARFAKRLTRYINKKFPSVDITMEYLWPGMLGVSKDLLPIMGPDEGNKRVWYIGAATGLPWAAALGSYGAQRLTAKRDEFDEIFSYKRRFVIGPTIQSLLTTPLTYAISNGLAEIL